jgi:hypothetical protein
MSTLSINLRHGVDQHNSDHFHVRFHHFRAPFSGWRGPFLCKSIAERVGGAVKTGGGTGNRFDMKNNYLNRD